ncbi:hypothetical protein BQ8482_530043 [Mesorhizobium delmotii]|uniref:Uncharacterized protein n=1 Tax=Mesorhizobium delmotii TaxID=1631247 RepID=A0A2P9AUT7_9HYPH|nr:hypothetical protein BQ8482_530043 [Mesorhizobium delmotii]
MVGALSAASHSMLTKRSRTWGGSAAMSPRRRFLAPSGGAARPTGRLVARLIGLWPLRGYLKVCMGRPNPVIPQLPAVSFRP